MKKIILGAIMLTGILYGQEVKVYQFENEIPKNIETNINSSISIT